MVSVDTVEIIYGVVSIGAITGGAIWGLMKYNGNKRSEMYKHIANTKGELEDKLRSSDVCEERHDGLKVQINGLHGDVKVISGDIKSLLRKNGISSTG